MSQTIVGIEPHGTVHDDKLDRPDHGDPMSDRPAASEAAQAFLAAERPEMPPLTDRTAWAYREVARADALERADRAVARHPVEITETEIASIPCTIVTPTAWDGAQEALYCFGGGYFSGSAREDLILAAPLAARSGLRITMVDYRLAPEHPYPAAIEDGLAVYRSLAQSTPLALIGESAGGNLALVLLQRALAEDLPLPRRIALLSPWCDLTPAAASAHNAEGDDPTLTPETIRAAVKIYADGADPRDPDLSPVFADWPSNLPPVLMTTGEQDLLRDQVLDLAGRLRDAGNACELNVHPHMWHVFEFYDELPEADRSLREIAEFLRLT
ncbi:MAG: alpha/beta hydrolase [Pseudomonadota bacterium]